MDQKGILSSMTTMFHLLQAYYEHDVIFGRGVDLNSQLYEKCLKKRLNHQVWSSRNEFYCIYVT